MCPLDAITGTGYLNQMSDRKIPEEVSNPKDLPSYLDKYLVSQHSVLI
jgi:hypothetical protein